MGTRKWFHPHLSGGDAEKLLKEVGFEGSFLVRPSNSKPGDFTLSVRRAHDCTHVKIQNSGDYYDLYGGEKFASLSELVQYYMENTDQLKEKNGQLITLKFPLLCDDPTTERWFHGGISGKEAERLLKENGLDGSFLVRASQSKPGDYSFSVRVSKDRISHVIIRNRNGKLDVGGKETFTSLADLVAYFRDNPMLDNGTSSFLELKHPLNTTRVNATSLKGRVAELEKETDAIYGKAGFWEEFEHLQQMESKNMFSRSEGLRVENKAKNRYKNIVPFDHTRVALKQLASSDVGADYINANFISGEVRGSNRAYIACQGPLPGTVEHFWQMIFEQNSRVIVMTTNETEKGKSKCAKYWPDVDETLQFGKFSITFRAESTFKQYVLRELLLEKEDDPASARLVWQFHYTSWPDHGVPEKPGEVLLYLHDVRECQAQAHPAGPIIVHCSAGIGRTGTFIAVDVLLNRIAEEGIDCDIDIQKTIHNIRTQRSGMVQTEAQYKFVYMAILHHIDILREKMLQEQLSSSTPSGVTSDAVYGNIPSASFPARQTAPKPNDGQLYENLPRSAAPQPEYGNLPAPRAAASGPTYGNLPMPSRVPAPAPQPVYGNLNTIASEGPTYGNIPARTQPPPPVGSRPSEPIYGNTNNANTGGDYDTLNSQLRQTRL
eukprot:Opistho-2@46561